MSDTNLAVCENGNEEDESAKQSQVNSQNAVDDLQRQIIKQLKDTVSKYEHTVQVSKNVIQELKKDLQIRTQERDLYNSQVSKLEKDILEYHTSVENPNNNAEDIVRARSMIFEKTKTCKNQELQIEALNQQISALREIITITKDMLEIRNMEVRELEQKLDCIELKYKTEKEHHGLINKKLERMVQINEDLRKEYENQLKLFKELRDGYEKRSQQNCNENGKSKTCIEENASTGPETTSVPDAPASDSDKNTTDS